MTPSLFQKYAADPAAFRNDLVIDVDGTVRKLGSVLEPWQRDDFAALDPALRRCNGQSSADCRSRAYLERPRGHSKTTDLAVMAVWALAFATRPIRAYAYAADKDQAGLLRDAMATIVRLNPWLSTVLDVQRNLIVNKASGHPGSDSKLDIAASEVGSSYGVIPDLIIADELTHWEENAAGLWHSILSSAAKRSNCLLVVISNAGFVDSWQWNVRESARTDESWIFTSLDGPQASWMTEQRLAEQRRMLPSIAFNRLWLNQWSATGGDALTPEVIEAAFLPGIAPQESAQAGYAYVAGLDLGVTRDASALCILGVRRAHEGHGRIRLAATRLWRPSKGHPVNLSEVERAVAELHARFRIQKLHYDPWQAQHMASRLSAAGLGGLEEVTPVGSNLQRMATAVLESFNDRRLELFDDPDLHRDVRRFRVEEKSYGFRLTSPRDSLGHGDLGTAFSLALLAAVQLAAVPQIWHGAGPEFSTPPWLRSDNPFQQATNEFYHEDAQRRAHLRGLDSMNDFNNRFADEDIEYIVRDLYAGLSESGPMRF